MSYSTQKLVIGIVGNFVAAVTSYVIFSLYHLQMIDPQKDDMSKVGKAQAWSNFATSLTSILFTIIMIWAVFKGSGRGKYYWGSFLMLLAFIQGVTLVSSIFHISKAWPDISRHIGSNWIVGFISFYTKAIITVTGIVLVIV